jgi:hypothetical protein
MHNEFVLDKKYLEGVSNLTLFYPSSGLDYLEPIGLFSPYITRFLFVDACYFDRSDSANTTKPVLAGVKQYRLMDKNISGSLKPEIIHKIDAKGHRYEDIEPCLLTETYKHLPTGKIIQIMRKRGFGFWTLRNDISSLGIFYYRGDGMEAWEWMTYFPMFGCGSNNKWLHNDHVGEVCDKLVDEGLFVTDGSNHQQKRPYYELWKNHRVAREIEKYKKEDAEKCKDIGRLIDSYKAFTDNKGRKFTCVGYAGYRYGPTMIWKVDKS